MNTLSVQRGGAERVSCLLHHRAASATLSTAAFCLPQNYRDRCVSSMCAHICSMNVAYVSQQRGSTPEKLEACCSSRFTHTLPTIAPLLLLHHHRAVCREGCLACESATVLSRQERNNCFTVLLVRLAAFAQHFIEGHRRLLAL